MNRLSTTICMTSISKDKCRYSGSYSFWVILLDVNIACEYKVNNLWNWCTNRKATIFGSSPTPSDVTGSDIMERWQPVCLWYQVGSFHLSIHLSMRYLIQNGIYETSDEMPKWQYFIPDLCASQPKQTISILYIVRYNHLKRIIIKYKHRYGC